MHEDLIKDIEYPVDKRKIPKRFSTKFMQRRISKQKSITIDKFVSSQIDLVDKQNIYDWISQLSSFHNRHTRSSYIHKVAEHLKRQILTIGYVNDNVYYHEYTEDGLNLENVICIKQGLTNKTILICGHYDTILNFDPHDTESRAPGADDNASGIAVILEIARIISKINLSYTILLALFSGEEQGLWGSKHYAKYVKENNIDLHLVINLDMCGVTAFLPSENTTFVDIDDGTTGEVDINNDLSQKFGNKMEQAALDYTNLKVAFDPIFASDYMPFEAAGYVCIGAYDGSAVTNNPNYHSPSDIPSNLDFNFLTSITKMVLAFILIEGKYVL
jgi:Zn-dependent M28 family amino/carboxypeptidase